MTYNPDRSHEEKEDDVCVVCGGERGFCICDEEEAAADEDI